MSLEIGHSDQSVQPFVDKAEDAAVGSSLPGAVDLPGNDAINDSSWPIVQQFEDQEKSNEMVSINRERALDSVNRFDSLFMLVQQGVLAKLSECPQEEEEDLISESPWLSMVWTDKLRRSRALSKRGQDPAVQAVVIHVQLA